MDMNNLILVTEQFDKFNINYSLGGSGLLLSLGLTDTVNDWDIMTDAPKENVLSALQQFQIEETRGGEYPFGTEYKLAIHEKDPQVEILGNFSVFSGDKLCKMPTIPVSTWQGVHVGAPEVWYVAYALMTRTSKAKLVLNYLKEQTVTVNKEVIGMLMKEPLPEVIVQELDFLLQK